tara:strand:+ start:217 stop:573 length:357 start_codon:yes stop_codon:yes gene_type:complete
MARDYLDLSELPARQTPIGHKGFIREIVADHTGRSITLELAGGRHNLEDGVIVRANVADLKLPTVTGGHCTRHHLLCEGKHNRRFRISLKMPGMVARLGNAGLGIGKDRDRGKVVKEV